MWWQARSLPRGRPTAPGSRPCLPPALASASSPPWSPASAANPAAPCLPPANHHPLCTKVKVTSSQPISHGVEATANHQTAQGCISANHSHRFSCKACILHQWHKAGSLPAQAFSNLWSKYKNLRRDMLTALQLTPKSQVKTRLHSRWSQMRMWELVPTATPVQTAPTRGPVELVLLPANPLPLIGGLPGELSAEANLHGEVEPDRD